MTFFEGGKCRYQLEGLENEANVFTAVAGALVFVHAFQRCAGKFD
jgi:hypothetical protein